MKTIDLSQIMAIASPGTLTAPAGAGPDSDRLVARPAMMPGPAGISALSMAERVAGSIVEPTAVTRPAMSGSINMIKIGRASWRGRVCQYVLISVVAGSLNKKKSNTDIRSNK